MSVAPRVMLTALPAPVTVGESTARLDRFANLLLYLSYALPLLSALSSLRVYVRA